MTGGYDELGVALHTLILAVVSIALYVCKKK